VHLRHVFREKLKRDFLNFQKRKAVLSLGERFGNGFLSIGESISKVK